MLKLFHTLLEPEALTTVRNVVNSLFFALLLAPFCFAQDPLPVLSSGWQRSVQKTQRPADAPQAPAAEFIPENKNFQRNAREAKMNAIDPNRDTLDGRRAAMDKVVQDSRTPAASAQAGYTYRTNVRNEGTKTVKVVFWEYRFKEIAQPAHVTRRQFLCSVTMKPGDTRELTAFSGLGPSDVITAESLGSASEKLFDEKVIINRIEFSDGTLLQRGNWKYDDVKAQVDRATQKPWLKEVCRPL